MSTVDYDELVASLPIPGVDEKPPDAGELSSAEVKEIRAQKRERRGGRRDWSNRMETMMVRVLEGAFGARNVKREADRMQGWQDAEGEWHYHYANYAQPDITFAAVQDGELKDGIMEVKSVAPTSNGLDVTRINIKPWQIRTMENNPDKIRLWGIGFWEGVGIARVFVIDHERFMRIIKEELPERAGGNFKGKSLRRKKDLDLLESSEVLKTNRWYLPENHWWRQ